MTAGIRPIIDDAVAAVLHEHPKYFTPRGHEHARTMLVRKIMAAIRGDGAEKPGDAPSGPTHGAQPMLVDAASLEGRAYLNLCRLALATSPFRTGTGQLSVPPEAATDAVYALADLPPQSQWLTLTERKQLGAWTEFFRETMPHAARRALPPFGELKMPWPWPPRKDGMTYDTAPPEESTTGQEDHAA